MNGTSTLRKRLSEWSIWLYAFGYFAFYIPYSFLAKAMSGGRLSTMDGVAVEGFSLLPVSVAASAVGMLVFISALRWWRYASHTQVLGINLPHPTRWTFFSGLCTALIIGTTTLAYTFEGLSIVFAMVLMRGGVLIIAPLVDAISRRKVHWYAWSALVCALAALLVSLADTDSFSVPPAAAVVIAIYLASYFVRFRFMSGKAKSEDIAVNRRYFVEEQMVAAPALVVMLAIAALIGQGDVMMTVREGFTSHWGESYLIYIVLIGIMSQGTGIFGSLVFLDKRENTYCVPVNRSSSILAGVFATLLLMAVFDAAPPALTRWISAGIIIVAILFLTIPPGIEKSRARARIPQKTPGGG